MGLTQDHAGGTKWWNAAAKPCDYCGSGAAILFCPVESAFMCMSCDTKAHNTDDKLAAPMKHARVWMCEVCEQAPAAVTCKADAAALCLACDQDIHSVNPLARRHERAAVVPFYDTAESMVMKSTAAMFADEITDRKVDTYVQDSWVSSNAIIPAKILAETPLEIKSMELLFSDSDQLLDFDNYQFCSQPYSDGVVPVQTTSKPPVSVQSTHRNSPGNRFEIDFTRSNITSNSNSYTAASLSHSVSSSSLDVGVVPDGGFISEISYPFSTTMNSSIKTRSNQTSQVVGMDREARVLRYKEKRKTGNSRKRFVMLRGRPMPKPGRESKVGLQKEPIPNRISTEFTASLPEISSPIQDTASCRLSDG